MCEDICLDIYLSMLYFGMSGKSSKTKLISLYQPSRCTQDVAAVLDKIDAASNGRHQKTL